MAHPDGCQHTYTFLSRPRGPQQRLALAQVEIHDGQLIGTLGKQQASRKTLRNSSRLLSNMGPGTFFGSGSLLNGEGDLQVLLSPITTPFR